MTPLEKSYPDPLTYITPLITSLNSTLKSSSENFAIRHIWANICLISAFQKQAAALSIDAEYTFLLDILSFIFLLGDYSLFNMRFEFFFLYIFFITLNTIQDLPSYANFIIQLNSPTNHIFWM